MTIQKASPSYKNFESNGSPILAWVADLPVEEAAITQLQNVAKLPFIYKHIAVLPDVHLGKGATVGSVIPTVGAIVPAAVGVDLGCVDMDTEFLSPTGWKRIVDYDGEHVLQVTDQGVASWCEKPAFIKLPCDKFYHFKTKYGVNQMLSEEHRMLLWRITGRDRRREMAVVNAADLAAEHTSLVIGANVEFKTTFDPVLLTDQRLNISDTALRVQVMLMADGHLENTSSCVVNFKKSRKIERAAFLLNSAEIPYTTGNSTGEWGETTWFRFTAPIFVKSYKNWHTRASIEQLKIITDECLKWDGTEREGVFFTRDKDSADFIQYAFSATGRRAVLREDVHYRDGKIDYRVFAHEHSLMVGLRGAPKSPVREVRSVDGFKYCFTTETGFWVMRRGGNIVLTGNCGMQAQKLSLKASDLPDSLKEARTAIEAAIPHGRTNDGRSGDRGAWSNPPDHVVAPWASLQERFTELCDKHPKFANSNNVNHLGTLGTGNHFVEVCLDEEQSVWVMLHSGSRGVGNAIGSYFIARAKEDMLKKDIHLPDKDLAYLTQDSEFFADYVKALTWAQSFAATNRQVMMEAALKALANTKGIPPFTLVDKATQCHHNYVSWEYHFGQEVIVTRKGAVSAQAGQLGIIPGSMGTKSYIVRGKGNPDSFCSCSHGAGRRMSRTAARKVISVEDHIKATEGVECRKDEDVVDESPSAYKDIDAVMEAQRDLVDVVHTLKQVLCVKG